jgi:hypothetical protein
MAKFSIVAGATSETVDIFVQDKTKTDGSGLTGLAYNTASLTCYYNFRRGASTSVTLATLVAATSAWSSGGFIEIDATHQPGKYRFDIPNSLLASGNGRYVGIYFQGAANMAPALLEIELSGWDNQDAVHGGMSALPNTAVTTNASLLTSGTGTDQLHVVSGVADANTKQILGGACPAVNVTGVPKVDVVDWLGSAPNALAQGKVDAALNLRNGTAQAGAAGSITLDAGASATDNLYRGLKVTIVSGTGAGQCRLISGYTGSTKVATVAPNWITNPDSTSVFIVGAWAGADVELWELTAPNALVSGRVDASVGSYPGNTAQTGDSYARLGAPIGASLSADIQEIEDALPANFANLSITAGGHITNVDTLTTYTGNTPQTGDAYLRLGAPAGASIAADILEIEDILPASFPANFANLGISAGGHVSNVDTLTTYTGNTAQTGDSYVRLGAPVGASISADIATRSAPGTAQKVDGTSPMTEGYGANGSGFTLEQGLYEIAQHIGERAIAGTTETVKKRDHSTTAETYTLSDATNPTSITRAT